MTGWSDLTPSQLNWVRGYLAFLLDLAAATQAAIGIEGDE